MPLRPATGLLACVVGITTLTFGTQSSNNTQESARRSAQVRRGKYLATIGVCAACHTPPAVSTAPPAASSPEESVERRFRTDPDWVKYLDPSKELAGGVPFLIRFSSTSHGVVVTSNITPDKTTGIGNWSEDEIVTAIREGKRPDGSSLFLFAPHTFFKNLALDDARSIAAYLKTLTPISNQIPARELPFPSQPATDITKLVRAPEGRSKERAEYLLSAVVGCRECHSHTVGGKIEEFTGGDPQDPFIGVFRLGPDLALRPWERGFAAFPFPGYAVLHAGNLTRYGKGGDLQSVPNEKIVRAVRSGISPMKDEYGRPIVLGHVMMWQFYSKMDDDDAYSIAAYLKQLKYTSHQVPAIEYFGEDWAAAFARIFGEKPSESDEKFFGKKK